MNLATKNQTLRPNPTPSGAVKRFCILRSLNILFWERSYEFVKEVKNTDINKMFDGTLPPSALLRASRVRKLFLRDPKYKNTILDLSSIETLQYLTVSQGAITPFLIPPVSLFQLKLTDIKLDMMKLIKALERTEIRTFIWSSSFVVEENPPVDLSKLQTLHHLFWRGPKFPKAFPPDLRALSTGGDQDYSDIYRASMVESLQLWDFVSQVGLDLHRFPNLRHLSLRHCKLDFGSVPSTVQHFEAISSDIRGEEFYEATGLRKVTIYEICNVSHWNEILDLRHCPDLEIVDCADDDEAEDSYKSITVLADLVESGTNDNRLGMIPNFSIW